MSDARSLSLPAQEVGTSPVFMSISTYCRDGAWMSPYNKEPTTLSFRLKWTFHWLIKYLLEHSQNKIKTAAPCSTETGKLHLTLGTGLASSGHEEGVHSLCSDAMRRALFGLKRARGELRLEVVVWSSQPLPWKLSGKDWEMPMASGSWGDRMSNMDSRTGRLHWWKIPKGLELINNSVPTLVS